MAPGGWTYNLKWVIFKSIIRTEIYNFSNSCDIVLRWMPVMPQDLSDDQSTLIQVNACRPKVTNFTWTNVDQALWCHVITRPQWVYLLCSKSDLKCKNLLQTNSGFEISNWMHLSAGQVDCKNHLSECTIHLSEIYKANATYVKIKNMQSSVGEVSLIRLSFLLGSDDRMSEIGISLTRLALASKHVIWLTLSKIGQRKSDNFRYLTINFAHWLGANL